VHFVYCDGTCANGACPIAIQFFSAESINQTYWWLECFLSDGHEWHGRIFCYNLFLGCLSDCIQFFLAESFNQPIGDWNVSSVTDMSGMVSVRLLLEWYSLFWDGTLANNGTYTHGACLFVIQFVKARSFDHPLSDWNVSSVTDMGYMVCALCVLGWHLH
jgi:surface protein